MSHGPEWYIRRALIEFLSAHRLWVEVTHGSRFQTGLPDLFITHATHGQRWIDVKNPGRYTFTPAQRHKWPLWEKHGAGIWILTAANEPEYLKLFGPPNWRDYWKPEWDIDVRAMIDAL